MKESINMRDLFLRPRSVAFVGVPRQGGPLSPLGNLLRWGYGGKVQLVHPHAREIEGFPAVREVAMLDGEADLAVISSPRDTVPGVISQCLEKGIRAMVVTNQGFGDADPLGRELQEAIVRTSRAGGGRILGPNTLGVVNSFFRFTTSFMPLEREESPVGVICQSGIFIVDARHLMGGMGIGVDIGNGCDVDLVESIEWLAREEELKVIAIHAEAIPQGRRFIETASKVSLEKPIVILKTGSSPEGVRAAISHTGSISGEDRILDGAFRKTGVVRVLRSDDMRDVVRGFLKLPPMRGPRVAMVTFTGGGGIILLDAMDSEDLQLAHIGRGALRAMRDISPPWMPIGNPMDIWPGVMKHGMAKTYRSTLKAVLEDPEVDAVVCVALALPRSRGSQLDSIHIIRELSERSDKPVLVWFYGPEKEEALARLEKEERILGVESLEKAAKVLGAKWRYERWRLGKEKSLLAPGKKAQTQLDNTCGHNLAKAQTHCAREGGNSR